MRDGAWRIPERDLAIDDFRVRQARGGMNPDQSQHGESQEAPCAFIIGVVDKKGVRVLDGADLGRVHPPILLSKKGVELARLRAGREVVDVRGKVGVLQLALQEHLRVPAPRGPLVAQLCHLLRTHAVRALGPLVAHPHRQVVARRLRVARLAPALVVGVHQHLAVAPRLPVLTLVGGAHGHGLPRPRPPSWRACPLLRAHGDALAAQTGVRGPGPGAAEPHVRGADGGAAEAVGMRVDAVELTPESLRAVLRP